MPNCSRLLTDDECWSAVLRRDRSADGAFYYAVRTTGVYCRPSCASRRALQRNVSFHASCEEAESLGFRPCKRCRPRESGTAQRHAEVIARACRRIEATVDLPNLKALAETSGLSPSHFQRVFKTVTGLTPKAYAEGARASRTRKALLRGNSVTDAFYEGGFNSSGTFYAASSNILGMHPTKFRSGANGESIRFAVGQCALGAILVAATDCGVCAILLGDEPGALVRDLQDTFPCALLTGDDPAFDLHIAAVVGFVETPAVGLDLPLDIRGTAFQQRVWKALQAVPPGSTVTYAEIARRVERPGSARAVARACASNRIALAIPCHRVIRTNGSISGYRWGVARKRELLQRESRREEG